MNTKAGDWLGSAFAVAGLFLLTGFDSIATSILNAIPAWVINLTAITVSALIISALIGLMFKITKGMN